MKTMKKRYFNRLHILITAALLLAPAMASAQESIEKLYSEYSKNSIIRPYQVKSWLIYSEPGNCDFNLVQDGYGPVDILRLPPEDFVSVSDFEIDSDIVYFCGMMSDGVPCMGYFDMNMFPNSTIHYIRLSSLKSVKKLEVMSDKSGAHVIMTGFRGQSDVIIEATPNATGWNVHFINLYVPNAYNNHSYDDIAILDNYVVVTSRYVLYVNNDNITPYNVSKLWYFSKPNPAIVSLTSSSVSCLEVPYYHNIHLGIEKCENDAFVIAGTGGAGVPYISGYNGTTQIGTVMLSKTNTRIKSISYCSNSKTTDVVIDPYDVATNGSEIYTLFPGMATIPGVAYGHRFPGQIINSLCYQSYNPLHYICVGDSIGNSNDLFIYRYFYNYIMECSELISVETTAEKVEEEPLPANIESSYIFYLTLSKEPVIKKTGTTPICISTF